MSSAPVEAVPVQKASFVVVEKIQVEVQPIEENKVKEEVNVKTEEPVQEATEEPTMKDTVSKIQLVAGTEPRSLVFEVSRNFH